MLFSPEAAASTVAAVKLNGESAVRFKVVENSKMSEYY